MEKDELREFLDSYVIMLNMTYDKNFFVTSIGQLTNNIIFEVRMRKTNLPSYRKHQYTYKIFAGMLTESGKFNMRSFYNREDDPTASKVVSFEKIEELANFLRDNNDLLIESKLNYL